MGSPLTGVLANSDILPYIGTEKDAPGINATGWYHGNFTQLKYQVVAAPFMIVLNAVATVVILKIIGIFVPLRMDEKSLQISDMAAPGEEASPAFRYSNHINRPRRVWRTRSGRSRERGSQLLSAVSLSRSLRGQDFVRTAVTPSLPVIRRLEDDRTIKNNSLNQCIITRFYLITSRSPPDSRGPRLYDAFCGPRNVAILQQRDIMATRLFLSHRRCVTLPCLLPATHE
jgi:hypothetical protein